MRVSARRPNPITRRIAAGAAVAAMAMGAVVGLSGASTAGERKTVGSDYTLVRSDPHAYVIGTAYRGDTIDIQQEASGGYRWGAVYRLGICAWTYDGALGQGPATADMCRHDAPRTVSGFTNGQVGTSPSGADGLSATFTPAGAGCALLPDGTIPAYGNVRPWLVPAQPSEQFAAGLVATDIVKWRYVSADGGWVMVHVPKFGDTDGVGIPSWFFVQRACIVF
ncbi:MAG: hypothetical protein WKH47_00960 [Actinomycetes bacterium]